MMKNEFEIFFEKNVLDKKLDLSSWSIFTKVLKFSGILSLSINKRIWKRIFRMAKAQKNGFQYFSESIVLVPT